MKIVWV